MKVSDQEKAARAAKRASATKTSSSKKPEPVKLDQLVADLNALFDKYKSEGADAIPVGEVTKLAKIVDVVSRDAWEKAEQASEDSQRFEDVASAMERLSNDLQELAGVLKKPKRTKRAVRSW